MRHHRVANESVQQDAHAVGRCRRAESPAQEKNRIRKWLILLCEYFSNIAERVDVVSGNETRGTSGALDGRFDEAALIRRRHGIKQGRICPQRVLTARLESGLRNGNNR